MFIDKETFVPGQTGTKIIKDNNLSITFGFTREDLQHDYSICNSCPLYWAMVRAGVPVFSVSFAVWVDTARNLHPFSDELMRTSDILHATNDKRRKRWDLLGNKVFVVKF